MTMRVVQSLKSRLLLAVQVSTCTHTYLCMASNCCLAMLAVPYCSIMHARVDDVKAYRRYQI